MMEKKKLLIPDTTPILGAVSWIAKPLTVVGSKTCSLQGTPTGLDTASRLGTKQVSYTSWQGVSRSYICSLTLRDVQHRNHRSALQERISNDKYTSDVPTEEELALESETTRLMYKQGLKMFYRGVGWLTQKQARQTKAIYNGIRHNSMWLIDACVYYRRAGDEPWVRWVFCWSGGVWWLASHVERCFLRPICMHFSPDESITRGLVWVWQQEGGLLF